MQKSTTKIITEAYTGIEIPITTKAWIALARKAGKSDFSLSILEQVYARGIIDAEPHPKNTPEQISFQRVDSFIHEGQAFELDYDLIDEVVKVPDGTKHMSIIKNAIKRHKEINKPVNESIGRIIGKAIFGKRSSRSSTSRQQKQPETPEERTKRKQSGMEADYAAKQAFQKNHPELSKDKSQESDGLNHFKLQKDIARKVVDNAIDITRAKAIATRYAQKKYGGKQSSGQSTKGPNDYKGFTAHERRKAWMKDIDDKKKKSGL